VKKEVTVGGDVPIQSELKPHDWLAEVCPGSNDRKQPDRQDSAPAAVERKLELRPTIEPKDWLTELGKDRQQKTPEAPEPTKKQGTFRRRRLSMTRTADPASADAAAAASAEASQEASAPTVANKLSTFRRRRLSMTRTADPASAAAATNASAAMNAPGVAASAHGARGRQMVIGEGESERRPTITPKDWLTELDKDKAQAPISPKQAWEVDAVGP